MKHIPNAFAEFKSKSVPHLWWLTILLLAILWRVFVIASGTVSFHSDEAIVGLMARHMIQGKPIPTFFYGQAYMGSLDPILVSIMFRLFGEGVLGIRLVQLVLYVGTVATTILLTWKISRNRQAAAIAGLLLAISSPVLTLYTTISLGGYNETLLIGNLLLLLTCELMPNPDLLPFFSTELRIKALYWFAFGALCGLGWWTNNLIVVYIIPSTVILIYRLKRNTSWLRWFQNLFGILIVAGVGFFLCSAPWWLYNISHEWASIRFLLGGFQSAATGTVQSVGILDRFVGFMLLGIPAVLGIRYSWTTQYWAGLLSLPIIAAYTAALLFSWRRVTARFLWWFVGCTSAIFVLSSFGVDATGRYLVPIIILISPLIGVGLSSIRRNRFVIVLLAAFMIAFNALGAINAMRTTPPGLTPQFDPATDFTNQYDQEVIRFLHEINATDGYGTYWSAYRLTFLSGETVILSPQLPYKSTLAYTPTDRYPAHTAEVDRAEHPVFVTANLPALDEIIAQRLQANSITFQQQRIGPYTIFYNFSRKMTPAELGLQSITRSIQD